MTRQRKLGCPHTATQTARHHTSRLEHVWTPLDIGPTRVKHRVMYTAQTLLYGENHLLSDRHIAFYRERAKGGTALMVTEQQAGHPLSKGSFYPGCTRSRQAGACRIFATARRCGP